MVFFIELCSCPFVDRVNIFFVYWFLNHNILSVCWESEWVTHVHCLLCFFPSPVITLWSPHCFPWSSDVVQNPTQKPSIHWLFQGETYCCPICLAVIKIRTVVPSNLSGYQLWQKCPPKLWGERFGMKNSLLGLSNMAEAEKNSWGKR